jgi:nucleotide-binding universal stress UspA family protein
VEDFMQRRIVVGVDGSPASADALRWAVAEAQATDGTVEAVYAWDPSPIVATGLPPLDWSQLRDAAEEHAAEIVRRAVGDQAAAEVMVSVVIGRPHEALAEASEDADLLVVGSRGFGGLEGIVYGSVGRHCAERARCPVLIVHHDPLGREVAAPREQGPRRQAPLRRRADSASSATARSQWISRPRRRSET